MCVYKMELNDKTDFQPEHTTVQRFLFERQLFTFEKN